MMADERRMVIIDDNPNDVALVRRALKKYNIDEPTVVLRDGAEALEYLFGKDDPAEQQPRHVEPMIILLDLKLPRVGGLDVLKRIRSNSRTKTLPVVVLTSSIEVRDVAEAYALGCNSYVHKPVDFSHFSEAIGRLADYWLNVNQPPLLPQSK